MLTPIFDDERLRNESAWVATLDKHSRELALDALFGAKAKEFAINRKLGCSTREAWRRVQDREQVLLKYAAWQILQGNSCRITDRQI